MSANNLKMECHEVGPRPCPDCRHLTYARHGFALEFSNSLNSDFSIKARCVWSWYCCEVVFDQVFVEPCPPNRQRMAGAINRLAARLKRDEELFTKYGATMLGFSGFN